MTNLEIAQTTEDQEILWSFRNDEDADVRSTVAERIKDQELLWSMRNDDDWQVRSEIACRVKGEDRLLKMLEIETDVNVINVISNRLAELGWASL